MSHRQHPSGGIWTLSARPTDHQQGKGCVEGMTDPLNMGAMWSPRARAAGFDPKRVRDATPREAFFIEVTARDMRGAVIGDPENCTGAKRVKSQRKATWAWIGVSTAILGFEDGSLVRYEHNGAIPIAQDQGFFPGVALGIVMWRGEKW